MARDVETGRFGPGESGNPGGRPTTVMAHTLSGRRARRALAELLSAMGPGLHVVVIDARGLVVDSLGGARRAGLDDDDGGELGGLPSRALDPSLRAAVQAAIDSELRAVDALHVEGWREVERERANEGGGVERIAEFHGPDGEVLGFVAWRALVEERRRELRVLIVPASDP